MNWLKGLEQRPPVLQRLWNVSYAPEGQMASAHILEERVQEDPGLAKLVLRLSDEVACWEELNQMQQWERAARQCVLLSWRKLLEPRAGLRAYKWSSEYFTERIFAIGCCLESLRAAQKQWSLEAYVLASLYGSGFLAIDDLYVRMHPGRKLTVSNNALEMTAAEKEGCGKDHVMAGAELCQLWDFPEMWSKILKHWPRPLLLADIKESASQLHLAILLAPVLLDEEVLPTKLKTLPERIYKPAGYDLSDIKPVVEEASRNFQESLDLADSFGWHANSNG